MNRKQRAFIQEYLIDFNATQAAIRAGYSPRSAQVTGSRLLSNAIIHKAIEAELMTPTEIRKRIEDIAKSGDKAQDRLRALKLAGQIHALFIDKQITQIEGLEVIDDVDEQP